MKNIVISQDFFPKIGGAHFWLYEVYRRWPSKVVMMAQDYSHMPEFSSKQVAFDQCNHGSLEILRKNIQIEDISLLNPKCLVKYIRMIRSFNSIAGKDSVVLHCLRAFPEGIAAMLFHLLNRRRCRFVTYAHGEELLVANTSRQIRSLAKLVYNLSSLVIANSNSTRRLVNELSTKARVKVIHPGVDMHAFDITIEERINHRKRWGWPNDTVILTSIARMEARKNHANVIKAVAELRKNGFPLAYIIGGGGEEKKNLERLVVELGLRKWIRFMGTISEAEKILIFASSDIFIMPSIKIGPMFEGFGIVFLEAAAAGVPSIAGNVGGQPEAVIHGKTGLIVNGRNLRDIQTAISRLSRDPALRRSMGEKGRLWAQKHDWQNVAHNIHESVRGLTL